jgi:zinc protease
LFVFLWLIKNHDLISRTKIVPNGLDADYHQDLSTPLVVVNLLYKVGSRNEQADKTGFAHLFEHLMFGGSANVPDFDKVLHGVGAENNAFTNTDITNYYIILNSANLETAFWVESDRMSYLNIDQEKLDIQKNVVVEEFNQRYLNVPYGDVWLNLRPLAYKVHPYKWATIGKKPEHIREAKLSDVHDFYAKHYTPDNAILTIAGNISPELAYELAHKWFGDIAGSMNEKRC